MVKFEAFDDLPRFEVVFGTYFNDGLTENPTAGTHTRIIIADSPSTARVVAHAMLGEEISASEFLCKPIVIGQTKKDPLWPHWSLDSLRRILQRMSKTLKKSRIDCAFIPEKYPNPIFTRRKNFLETP
jgi:hypothetical protein